MTLSLEQSTQLLGTAGKSVSSIIKDPETANTRETQSAALRTVQQKIPHAQHNNEYTNTHDLKQNERDRWNDSRSIE